MCLMQKNIFISGLMMTAVLSIMIVLSLNNHQSLLTELADKQALLQWMQQNAPLVQKNHSATAPSLNHHGLNVLGKIQQTLTANNLDNNADKIEQIDSKKIKITFKKVSFDDLLKWLIFLHTSVSPRMDIYFFTAQKTAETGSETGMVSAEVILV